MRPSAPVSPWLQGPLNYLLGNPGGTLGVTQVWLNLWSDLGSGQSWPEPKAARSVYYSGSPWFREPEKKGWGGASRSFCYRPGGRVKMDTPQKWSGIGLSRSGREPIPAISVYYYWGGRRNQCELVACWHVGLSPVCQALHAFWADWLAGWLVDCADGWLLGRLAV